MSSSEKNDSFIEFFRQRRSLIIIILTIMAVCGGLFMGYRYIIDNYTVTRVYVDGSSQYTNAEIIDMVMQGPYGDNSLILSWRYKDRSIDGIPFIEKMDVSIQSNDTIRIFVYEKAVAGYVEFLGHFLYFDREGTIVESSTERRSGIPEVVGLNFDYAVMYEPLPVKDAGIFGSILSLRNLLERYELPADRIFISDRNEVTLFFGDVMVALGREGYIDEKIMALTKIMPSIVHESGILRMEHYNEYSTEVIFEAK